MPSNERLGEMMKVVRIAQEFDLKPSELEAYKAFVMYACRCQIGGQSLKELPNECPLHKQPILFALAPQDETEGWCPEYERYNLEHFLKEAKMAGKKKPEPKKDKQVQPIPKPKKGKGKKKK